MNVVVNEMLAQLRVGTELGRFLPTVAGTAILNLPPQEVTVICEVNDFSAFEHQIIKQFWFNDRFKIIKGNEKIEASFFFQDVRFKFIARDENIFEQKLYKATFIIEKFDEITEGNYSGKLKKYLSKFHSFEEGVGTLLNLSMTYEEVKNYLKEFSESIVKKIA
ncbi:MAG: DUF4269 domain-containing protein [Fusobacteria bacterium]|nr:DUF4269 domain-containing protein [Fusobacteriota bacterium]